MRLHGDSRGPRGRSLTEAEIAALHPVRSGAYERAVCPFCGSNGQRAFQIDRGKGSFRCFYCSEWGYTAEARREYLAQKAGGEFGGASRSRPAPLAGGASPLAAALGRIRDVPRRDDRPCRPGLVDELERFRRALCGSPAEIYLARRRIPLELAVSLGAGYAAPGTWPSAANGRGARVRDWPEGRIVFPHRAPDGTILNLYSRAVEISGRADDEVRHDHLGGVKGYFNAPVLTRPEGLVFVGEGVFDALALMAAGVGVAIAIFGVNGWRWEWMRLVRHFVFAMDADEAGQTWKSIAIEARLRGLGASYVPSEAYGGAKDVSEAWERGVLELDGFKIPPPAPSPERAGDMTAVVSKTPRVIPTPAAAADSLPPPHGDEPDVEIEL